MSALAKVQRDFCQFILGHGHVNFMEHMKSTNVPKEEQLNVYYHNIFSVHRQSLAVHYPLVFSLVGEDVTQQLVRDYVQTSMPCIGSLSDWGIGFISFLQQSQLVAEWPHLQEIAQFEWSKHIAYGSSEEPLLTINEIKKYTQAEHKEVRFQFQTSCQLLAFQYPIKEIIEAHEQNRVHKLTQVSGSSYALIVKHQGIIKVYWLTAALFAFINRLMEGQDIEVAYAAAQVLEPMFNAQKAFQFLFDNPILHG